MIKSIDISFYFGGGLNRNPSSVKILYNLFLIRALDLIFNKLIIGLSMKSHNFLNEQIIKYDQFRLLNVILR